jgi:hypothetical protein
MASEGQDDKYADWLTPAQAVDLLSAAFGNDSQNYHAKQTLLDALRSGIVISVAQIAVDKWKSGATGYEPIPKRHWDELGTDSSHWTTTHVTYKYPDGSTMSGWSSVSRFGVRFDPAGVRTLLPPSNQASLADTKTDSRKSVSKSNLEAWYELYSRLYPESLNTEPHAVKSAQGMFHDKAVSRDAVREVRGSHKPGPKGPRPQD